MLKCEFCSGPLSGTLTLCCKAMVCSDCRDRLDKKQQCLCGKTVAPGKKAYAQHPQILHIMTQFEQGRAQECDRCEAEAEVDCVQCAMLYCRACQAEVHDAIGFAKHTRTAYSYPQCGKIRERGEWMCSLHSQPIQSGCECGAGLCAQCFKSHKEQCSKSGKARPIKQFKDEYFVNVVIKMRQLQQLKSGLTQDLEQHMSHFNKQRETYQKTVRNISEQFQFVRQMLDAKQAQVKSRLEQYWDNCQRTHSETLTKVKLQLSKYDTLGQLLHKFSDHMVNLDYFERKIKRVSYPLEWVGIKVSGIEQAASTVMGIDFFGKEWQGGQSDVQGMREDRLSNPRQEARLMGDATQASQLLLQYSQRPMEPRQLHLVTSHSQVHYSFLHLPYQHLQYQIEYGVGMKIKGTQIFKRVSNSTGLGVIEGLNPSTKYRVRMRVVQGQWSKITQINTLQIPRFSLENSMFAKNSGEGIQLGKGGSVYGSNEISFGVHRWVIRINAKTISYEDSETACLSVGVANRESKKAVFVGSTLNYGYQKIELLLKVLLDCGQRRMVIACEGRGQEVYNNLPVFPVFAAIQNKGNAQVMVRYNLTTDDPTLC